MGYEGGFEGHFCDLNNFAHNTPSLKSNYKTFLCHSTFQFEVAYPNGAPILFRVSVHFYLISKINRIIQLLLESNFNTTIFPIYASERLI